jgi:hypothetical protein
MGGTSFLALPAPANPAAHSALYTALIQFNIGVGILQTIILVMRLFARSKIGKIAETVGNLVFWFGAAFLVNEFLLRGTLGGWFQYWGALIIVIGVSLVVRGFVHLAKLAMK